MANVYTSTTCTTTEKSLITGANGPVVNTQTVKPTQAGLNLVNLVAGDSIEIKLYEKADTAEAQQLIATYQFAGIPADKLVFLPALGLGSGYDVTCKKLTGTDRVVGLSLRT